MNETEKLLNLLTVLGDTLSSCPATFNLSLTASPSCITRMPGRLTCKKCLTGPSTGQAPT